jgi:RNA polymerase sigma factor (sigma-70 family)
LSVQESENGEFRLGEVSATSDRRAGRPTENADESWAEFLQGHAPLILQVVHLFERDQDQVQDCFLFVCERLRRDGLRRIRRFRAGGAASFATWLRAVVRHLCLDWRRHRDGRLRLPRAIARLTELDQEVFRCLHLRRLSENETFHSLTVLWPGLDREQLGNAVARVGKSLRGRQSWLVLTHRPRLQSLSADATEADAAETEPGLVDPRADPEHDAAARERLLALRNALSALPPQARLMLQLRYEQELTLEEVACHVGLSGVAQAERQIQQALEALRTTLGAQGFVSLSVKEE